MTTQTPEIASPARKRAMERPAHTLSPSRFLPAGDVLQAGGYESPSPDLERAELVDSMWSEVPSAIGYWADFTPDNPENTDCYRVGDWEDPEDYAETVTREQFDQALTTWAEWFRDMPNGWEYARRFAADWLAGEFGNADYDATLIDQVFQFAAFGRVIYG